MSRQIRVNGQTFTVSQSGQRSYVYGPNGYLGVAGPYGTYSGRGGCISPSNSPGLLMGFFGRLFGG